MAKIPAHLIYRSLKPRQIPSSEKNLRAMANGRARSLNGSRLNAHGRAAARFDEEQEELKPQKEKALSTEPFSATRDTNR